MSEEAFLAREVKIDGSLADLSSLGNALHGGMVEAILEEHLSSRLEDGSPALPPLALATRTRAHTRASC
jgi:hypothetical protein